MSEVLTPDAYLSPSVIPSIGRIGTISALALMLHFHQARLYRSFVLNLHTDSRYSQPVMPDRSKDGQIATEWYTSRTFLYRFMTFLVKELKCTENDLQKSQI